MNDPVAFAHDCIDWGSGAGLASYQEEVLRLIVEKRRVSVRGPHTLGKTAIAAITILWFALTRSGLPDKSDWKVLTTASVARQLTEFLWPEIHKWAARIKWEKLKRPPFNRDELMAETLKLSGGKAIAMTASEETGTEGGHADHLLYVFDEAKAIETSRWDAAEGALMGGVGKEVLALAISTPGEPQGRFYDIQTKKPGYEDWYVRHVSITECVTAGRATQAFADQRARQWGEASAVFQNRVLGEFCESSEDAVIPLSWIEAANERYAKLIEIMDANWNWIDGSKRGEWPKWRWKGEPIDLDALGVDIARSDNGDKTVIARKQSRVITQLDRYSIADTMPIVGYTATLLNRWKQAHAMVDVIGIGAGPLDRLREQKLRAFPFNAAEATDFVDRSGELRFANKRSAAWWNFRELLDPAYGSQIALPPCDMLTGDLTAPRRGRMTSGGKILIESKIDIRKRLGRSTDDGDAVVMAFYPLKADPPPDETYSYSYVDY